MLGVVSGRAGEVGSDGEWLEFQQRLCNYCSIYLCNFYEAYAVITYEFAEGQPSSKKKKA